MTTLLTSRPQPAATAVPNEGVETIPFAKYQGAGNDFVIVDARPAAILGSAAASRERDWSALAERVCGRHFGVGADGLLVASAPSLRGAAERMRMYNPDGSESEMCGNGLRCFVRWLVDRGEVLPGDLAVETGAGVLVAHVASDGHIAVDMGRPRLAPHDIPVAADAARGQPADGPVLNLVLDVAGHVTPARRDDVPASISATCVSMGNPHAVVFVPDVAPVALDVLGPALELHPAFPAHTNVEIVTVVGRDRLRMRVWERGAGLTLACGTGACAAVVAARLHTFVDDRVAVELPGGTLEVTWSGRPSDTVTLTGPVEHVFDGQYVA